MGLIDKIRKKEEAQKKHLQPNSEEDLFLNKEDLKYLLTLIKDSTFQGREIEIIYNYPGGCHRYQPPQLPALWLPSQSIQESLLRPGTTSPRRITPEWNGEWNHAFS